MFYWNKFCYLTTLFFVFCVGSCWGFLIQCVNRLFGYSVGTLFKKDLIETQNFNLVQTTSADINELSLILMKFDEDFINKFDCSLNKKFSNKQEAVAYLNQIDVLADETFNYTIKFKKNKKVLGRITVSFYNVSNFKGKEAKVTVIFDDDMLINNPDCREVVLAVMEKVFFAHDCYFLSLSCLNLSGKLKNFIIKTIDLFTKIDRRVACKLFSSEVELVEGLPYFNSSLIKV